MAKARDIAATEFRTRCLTILGEVSDAGAQYLITKRGRPIARLVPVRAGGRRLRGAWKNAVEVEGYIVHGGWSDEFEATR